MLGIDAAFGPVYWKSLGLNAFYEQSFFLFGKQAVSVKQKKKDKPETRHENKSKHWNLTIMDLWQNHSRKLYFNKNRAKSNFSCSFCYSLNTVPHYHIFGSWETITTPTSVKNKKIQQQLLPCNINVSEMCVVIFL